MEELHEEIEALRAILMNDVTISDVSDGKIQVDMKMENCTVMVQFLGKLKLLRGSYIS